MFNWFDKQKIVTKIQIGFAAVAIIMVGIVSITIWQTNSVKSISDTVVDLRVPTAQFQLDDAEWHQPFTGRSTGLDDSR